MRESLIRALEYCERNFAGDERVKEARVDNSSDELLFWLIFAGYLQKQYGYTFPTWEAKAELEAQAKRTNHEWERELTLAAKVLIGKGVRRVYVAREADGGTQGANVLNALPVERPLCEFPLDKSARPLFVRYNDAKISWQEISSLESRTARSPRRGIHQRARAQPAEKETEEPIALATSAMGDCIGLMFFLGLQGGAYETIALAHLPGGDYGVSAIDPRWTGLLDRVGARAEAVAVRQPMDVQALICVTGERLMGSGTVPAIIDVLRGRGFSLPQILVYVAPNLTGFAVDSRGRFGTLSSTQVLALEGD